MNLNEYLTYLSEDFNVVDNWEMLLTKVHFLYDSVYSPCKSKCTSTGTIFKKRDPSCLAKCRVLACKKAISYLKVDVNRCKSHPQNQQKQCYKIYSELIENYEEEIKNNMGA